MHDAASPNLKTQQIWVFGQIALSVPLQLLFVRWGYNHAGFVGPAGDSMGDRLAYALQWDLLGALVLLAMIGFLAGSRPIRHDTIDGNDRAEALAIHVRVQRNTVEQLMLMLFGHLTLATVLRVDQLHIIPVLALLFVVSRVAYWIGYVRAPHYRTLGFVATFYPNIAALLYSAWRIYL
ncbi:MAPEG family protein [Erythrobacter sp. W302b]|uniref:MAPEG family protein n=1 Tax=Erythrobacter sp. W302b TaxID=3389874 RepID=UPI00396B056A